MQLLEKQSAASCSAYCNVEGPKMRRCQCRCSKHEKALCIKACLRFSWHPSSQCCVHIWHFHPESAHKLNTQLLRAQDQTLGTSHTSVSSKVAPYRRLLEKPLGKTVYKSSPSALTSSFLVPLLALLTSCSPNTALA